MTNGHPEPGDHPPIKRERLILRVIRAARARVRRGEEVQIRHLVEPLGPDASTIGCIIVATPFLAPFSLGPISAPASVFIALAGLRLMKSGGRQEEEGTGTLAKWRERALSCAIPHTLYDYLHRFLGSLTSFLRRYSRPRLEVLVNGRMGRMVVGMGFIFGALVLAIPTPGIPLMNTLPALGIILLGAACIRRDGYLVIGSYAALLGAIILIGTLALGVGVLGAKGIGAAAGA